MFFPLDAPMKNYAWGSPDEISAFRGSEASGQPEAEQWFGQHPQSQTSIVASGETHVFAEWLLERGLEFPVLVKLLAAAQPLSIQVHPSFSEAAEGFAAEERRGVDEAQRTYRDSSAKPELLVALSSGFRALVGFVEPETIAARLELWRAAGLGSATAGILNHNLGGPLEQSVRWLLGEGHDLRRCLEGIDAWVSDRDLSADLAEEGAEEVELVRNLWSFYPNDPGVLFSLLMHHVVLGRGEALFVDAGVVHAYLQGFGLEVMLPSDNVVRAGLTAKRRDGPEFLKVAKLSSEEFPPVIRPVKKDNVWSYTGLPADFHVSHIVAPGDVSLNGAAAIVLVESGAGPLSGNLSARPVGPGEVIFVTGDEMELSVSEADTSLWVVHPARSED